MGLYLQHNETKFQVGDKVKVRQIIREGKKERIQIFAGLVIKIRGHKGEKTFTVRKISSGIGVEKIFPVDSPFIKEVEVEKKGKVARAKLYYLRDRTGRSALKVKPRLGAKEQKKAEKIAKDKKDVEKAKAKKSVKKEEAKEVKEKTVKEEKK